MLKAFKKVHSKHQSLYLLVAGEYYTDSHKYTELIKDLEIEDKVIMHTDFISDEKVKYYFGLSDLISQTYKSASQSGISQIAIHFEKPMICTNVGGLPEVVNQGINGVLVEPNVESVAMGIDAFFTNKPKYFDDNGMKKLKLQYSWTTFTEELLNIYDDLCSKNDTY